MLYRDIWFDKPPLYALVYTLWGAGPGWPLRIGGTVFIFAACLLGYRFARELWTEREGVITAWLLGLALTFGTPSAVMALAPDLLMLLPHLGAVYLAWRGKAFWSGVVAALAFLCNTKGVLVLLACLLWQWQNAPAVLVGFALPNLLGFAILLATGALPAYWQQVWVTGLAYTHDTFVEHPVWEGFRRTLNWAGFHATLCIGAGVYWSRKKDWRWLAWTLLALVSVFAGWRFFPRYYFALLPPLAVAAARGLMLLQPGCRFAVAGLLLLPILRYGPTYGKAAASRSSWSDTALMEDSREVAAVLRQRSQPGQTLFIWGYRPDIFVFSSLPAGTPFLDSQPVSGIFADRHLFSTHVSVQDTEENVQRLVRTRPSFVVDGLGLLNHKLGIGEDVRLRSWLANYREAARTSKSIVYNLRSRE